MAEENLLHYEFTRAIIGSAMEVHKTLGHGFLESVYEEALSIEFELRKMDFERQKEISIFYKERSAKKFICDFLIENSVLVEIKAISQLARTEEAQLINYLKASGIKVGLLINFGEKSLKHKRFVF